MVSSLRFTVDVLRLLVLQGAGDVGKQLTEHELQSAMEFCAGVFAPTTPEMYEDVAKRIDKKLMDVNGPILLPEDIVRIVGADDPQAIHVLKEINARKPIHTVYDVAVHFGSEALEGFVPTVKRGELGLTRCG